MNAPLRRRIALLALVPCVGGATRTPAAPDTVAPPSSYLPVTLADTIEFFNLILETHLTADEKKDLEAFLRVL